VLVRSGASSIEAKELARHADIRQTSKYTHIGMEERAEALAGLPAPKPCAFPELSEIRRERGGVLGQEVSVGDSNRMSGVALKNEKTPSGEGVSSFLVTGFREVSVDARSEGGGNCTRVPDSASRFTV
jgi:hypothetical protein